MESNNVESDIDDNEEKEIPEEMPPSSVIRRRPSAMIEDRVADSLRVSQQNLTKALAENQSLMNEITVLKEQLSVQSSLNNEQLNNELQRAQEKSIDDEHSVDAFKAALKKKEIDLKHLEADRIEQTLTLQTQLDSLKKQNFELADTIDQLKGNIDDLHLDLHNLRAQKAEFDTLLRKQIAAKALSEHEEQTAALLQKMTEEKQQFRNKAVEYSKKHYEMYTNMKRVADEREQELEKLKTEFRSTHQSLSRAEVALKKCETEEVHLRRKITDLEKEHHRLSRELKSKAREHSTVEKKLSTVIGQLEEAQAKASISDRIQKMNCYVDFIHDPPFVGEILTANSSINAEESLFQWFRCFSASDEEYPISGASSSEYIITADDIGASVRLRVASKVQPEIILSSSFIGPIQIPETISSGLSNFILKKDGSFEFKIRSDMSAAGNEKVLLINQEKVKIRLNGKTKHKEAFNDFMRCIIYNDMPTKFTIVMDQKHLAFTYYTETTEVRNLLACAVRWMVLHKQMATTHNTQIVSQQAILSHANSVAKPIIAPNYDPVLFDPALAKKRLLELSEPQIEVEDDMIPVDEMQETPSGEMCDEEEPEFVPAMHLSIKPPEYAHQATSQQLRLSVATLKKPPSRLRNVSAASTVSNTSKISGKSVAELQVDECKENPAQPLEVHAVLQEIITARLSMNESHNLSLKSLMITGQIMLSFPSPPSSASTFQLSFNSLSTFSKIAANGSFMKLIDGDTYSITVPPDCKSIPILKYQNRPDSDRLLPFSVSALWNDSDKSGRLKLGLTPNPEIWKSSGSISFTALVTPLESVESTFSKPADGFSWNKDENRIRWETLIEPSVPQFFMLQLNKSSQTPIELSPLTFQFAVEGHTVSDLTVSDACSNVKLSSVLCRIRSGDFQVKI